MDFAYPIRAFGFSSGWRDEFSLGEATRRVTDTELFFRRSVGLHPAGSAQWHPWAPNALPFEALVKRAPGNGARFPGLSSGAGSALVQRDGRVFRYKRCGWRDLGLPGTSFNETFSRAQGFDLIEFESIDPIGLMQVNRARNELAMVAELHEQGLCPHCVPHGLVEVEQLLGGCRFEYPVGAAIFGITSDVRADEFVMICLTPFLLDMLEQGFYVFNEEDFTFSPRNVPFSVVQNRWAFLFEDLGGLGNLIGRAYRRLHDMGYFRGRGNTWFGNEVIGPDGTISFVDVDELCRSDGLASVTMARLVRSMEVNEYTGRASACLSSYSNFPVAWSVAATYLSEGFRDGYTLSGNPLDAEAISTIMSRFEGSIEAFRAAIRRQSRTGYLPDD